MFIECSLGIAMNDRKAEIYTQQANEVSNSSFCLSTLQKIQDLGSRSNG